MRGSEEEALGYLGKQGKVEEWGERAKPGRRTDLERALECGSLREAVAVCPEVVVRYPRGLQTVFALRSFSNDDIERKVLWFFGGTGCGKTREAVRMCRELYPDSWVMLDVSRGWFDGYDGQKAVILDDLRAGHLAFAQLLRILDRYPCTVPVKGSTVGWQAELIIITCPRKPDEEFVNHQTGQAWEDIAQVTRRCAEVRRFGALKGCGPSWMDPDGLE